MAHRFHDDFQSLEVDEDAEKWKRGMMTQVGQSVRSSRLQYITFAVVSIFLLAIIITIGVNNVRVQKKFEILENSIANFSFSSNIDIQLLKDEDQVFKDELLKLRDTIQSIEQQLVTVQRVPPVSKDVNLLRSQLESLKCQFERIQKNETGKVCCSEGWVFYSGSCYFISSDKLDWNSARDYCISWEGHLLVVDNDTEWMFVTSFTKPRYYWIGLTDERTGKWEWVDGTDYKMHSQHWKPGQPDNWKGHGLGGGEDCAHLHNDGRYNDDHCSRQYFYVCEKKNP
ncbi:asialoglycoprotein receptor 1 [Polypterus senegalus]